MKKFFLISNPNLSWHNLKPCVVVLLLVTWEKKPTPSWLEKKEQMSPFMEPCAPTAWERGYLGWHTRLHCSVPSLADTPLCYLGDNLQGGGLQMLREVGSAGAREDFIAETWTSVANFAAAYLRHMHGTNRYYTALQGDSPSGVSDGGKEVFLFLGRNRHAHTGGGDIYTKRTASFQEGLNFQLEKESRWDNESGSSLHRLQGELLKGGLVRKGKLLSRRKFLLENTCRDIPSQPGSCEPGN
nr:uncharacterized protein LOC113459695 [Zonotrichia albicollis]